MVTIYTRTNCPWCTKLKSYLKNNNIIYNEINITTNEDGFNYMKQISNQSGVPITDINGTIVIGYDKSSIDKLLNIE
ncbi:MAG: glutaredoxin domain-containing protein [Clostridium sp.]